MFKLALVSLVWIALLAVTLPSVQAQTFSATSPESYSCVGVAGAGVDDAPDPRYDARAGKVVCDVGGGTYDALPKPPDFRQLQVWFVSLVYMLWSLAGVFFTGLLIFLGFMYMTSQGNPDKLADVTDRIQKWGLGLVIVFLAYPMLTTAFSLIGFNPCLTNDIDLPGFQFFFEDAFDPAEECG